MTINDRDALIRLAILPPADVVAPADLGDAIHRQVLATPQRRGLVRLGRLGWVAAPSPAAVTLALLALLALALVVAGLLRPQPPILSTYHGGPDRTGVMPGPGPAGRPSELWVEQRKGGIPFTSMPLPAGDRVFVGDTGGFIAALDAATGDVLWEDDVGAEIHGAPALAGTFVVVGTEAGEVVAYAASGDDAWRRQLGAGPVGAALLVADGVIYAGTSGGRLIALSPADGRSLWEVPVGGAVRRAPAFADGVVYVGTEDGRLSAIDVDTRAERWAIELGRGQVGTPAIAGGRVYVARGIEGPDPVHDLVALDVGDGSVVWSFASETGLQVHVGAIAHGRVYAVSEDGSLHAIDPATGQPIWTVLIGGRLATLATVAGDVVYVSSTDGSIHAIEAGTGRELWVVEVDVGEPTMAVVVGGRVYVGTNLGRVVAFGDAPAS